jgi:salicylate hydroxylase
MAVLLNRPRIAIVGAGIGGLAAAAALARHGLHCVVFEQSERFEHVGAGIQLSPNSTRLLDRLGLLQRLSGVATRPDAIEVHRWEDSALIGRTVLGATCEYVYGAPYLTLHRADLHAALLDAARPADLRTGLRLAKLVERHDDVELHFADGSSEWADLVIGADGIRSVVRGAVVPDEPSYTGLTVHRGLVPAGRVTGRATDPVVRIWLGPGRHCVAYPVHGGRTISFAAVTAEVVPAWGAAGSVCDLVDAYAGWHADVLGLLSRADAVTRWALIESAPLIRWCTDRIALLGDAAHPLLPLGAQGANQAIEDAFGLAAHLRAAAPGSMPEALRRYQRLRMARVAAVMASVRRNTEDHHLADGPAQRSRDHEAPWARSLERLAWLYSFDAEWTGQ